MRNHLICVSHSPIADTLYPHFFLLWRLPTQVMNKQHVVRTDRVEAISGEAHLHKQLCHPGICRLLGTAQDTDNLYLLLELLSGGELYSLLYEETSPITGGRKCTELTEKNVMRAIPRREP